MKLEDLGYNPKFEKFRTENNLTGFEPGRIIAEHKERYIVRTADAEVEAEITGNMRFTASGREDFPAVGDWVALSVYDTDFGIIHKIFPRYSLIKRQAVGQFGEIQIIATNIDFAFLVQAADRDFNINRLERYLTLCHSSKVAPIIILTKTDLIEPEKVSEIVDQIKIRISDVPIFAISNETRDGFEAIIATLQPRKTYCMLGSSGVGKSSLLNNLSGKSVMRTDAISQSTQKGRHITSHRELILLENGGLLIDNPGMREVGIADSTGGLEQTFDRILSLSEHCKFKDCRHISEVGCAVLEAIEKGEIDESSYKNYLKLEREKAHFETSATEKKKKDKIMGKVIKKFYQQDFKRKQ
ncbi:MAG: ribosome small subunit-dependent GTPase A [Bacteroidetes bacterium]|nr:ribosome small subunit-dependent GTPase A [Bacteroidota bacterium]